MLYPLKFDPIYKKRIWGGNNLRNKYNRLHPADMPVGESWEISGMQENLSVVTNGFLAGNDIQEVIEVYMGDLVGDHIYLKYGIEFPVLLKLLNAQDILSIQVHPDDELAIERHGAYGKTEMWYVMEAEDGASMYLGFNRDITEEEYRRHLSEGTLTSLLRKETPRRGEVYFIPAGTIHAIGKGLILAEIQQTSDITYRMYDWDRTDSEGNPRELHTELALDALDLNRAEGLKIDYTPEPNRPVRLVRTAHFETNLLDLEGTLERDYADLDSFVLYLCLEGEAIVECEGGAESLLDTETVLLPAEFDSAVLRGKARILEIYMPK